MSCKGLEFMAYTFPGWHVQWNLDVAGLYGGSAVTIHRPPVFIQFQNGQTDMPLGVFTKLLLWLHASNFWDKTEWNNMALYSRKHCAGPNFDFAWTEFCKFETCYILTIGTENNDFCLILGARCIAIGLYMMLEGRKSYGVLFLKPDSLKNFGPPPTWQWVLYFHTANAVCLTSRPFLMHFFVSDVAFFWVESSRMAS